MDSIEIQEFSWIHGFCGFHGIHGLHEVHELHGLHGVHEEDGFHTSPGCMDIMDSMRFHGFSGIMDSSSMEFHGLHEFSMLQESMDPMLPMESMQSMASWNS